MSYYYIIRHAAASACPLLVSEYSTFVRVHVYCYNATRCISQIREEVEKETTRLQEKRKPREARLFGISGHTSETLSHFTRAVKCRNVLELSYPCVDRLDKKRPRGSLGRFPRAKPPVVNNDDSKRKRETIGKHSLVPASGREEVERQSRDVLVSEDDLAGSATLTSRRIAIRHSRLRERGKKIRRNKKTMPRDG